MPRSAIIWTRSRELSLKARYHLTHRMMISWSKCRPLNRSCAEVGSVIPAVIAVYRALQQFAPEPLRLGFTDVLKSPTAYETLERSVLQPRLLLCLHGIGTNAGLQRMAGLESGVTAKDLAYVRRRYISSVDMLRQAIAIVTDGTLRARNPAIWGTCTPKNWA